MRSRTFPTESQANLRAIMKIKSLGTKIVKTDLNAMPTQSLCPLLLALSLSLLAALVSLTPLVFSFSLASPTACLKEVDDVLAINGEKSTLHLPKQSTGTTNASATQREQGKTPAKDSKDTAATRDKKTVAAKETGGSGGGGGELLFSRVQPSGECALSICLSLIVLSLSLSFLLFSLLSLSLSLSLSLFTAHFV
jgi:hypothetical protein